MDKETKKLKEEIKCMDAASFDTSSHHTIDYLIKTKPAKSYTYGQGNKYIHLKRQRPTKRSLSAGNFNWNILVNRLEKRFNKEAKIKKNFNSGHPMSKLRSIIGENLLEKIKNEIPELYEALMEHIKNKK